MKRPRTWSINPHVASRGADYMGDGPWRHLDDIVLGPDLYRPRAAYCPCEDRPILAAPRLPTMRITDLKPKEWVLNNPCGQNGRGEDLAESLLLMVFVGRCESCGYNLMAHATTEERTLHRRLYGHCWADGWGSGSSRPRRDD